MTVWKAREFQIPDSKFQIVGEIIEAKGDKLLIVCGNQTILQIEELQLEGKRRMATRDFINGVKIQIGDVLES